MIFLAQFQPFLSYLQWQVGWRSKRWQWSCRIKMKNCWKMVRKMFELVSSFLFLNDNSIWRLWLKLEGWQTAQKRQQLLHTRTWFKQNLWTTPEGSQEFWSSPHVSGATQIDTFNTLNVGFCTRLTLPAGCRAALNLSANLCVHPWSPLHVDPVSDVTDCIIYRLGAAYSCRTMLWCVDLHSTPHWRRWVLH